MTDTPRTKTGRLLERIVRNAMPAADGVRDFILRIEAEAAAGPRDERLREAAQALVDATDRYLDSSRSPNTWGTDRGRLWSALTDVRAALKASDD